MNTRTKIITFEQAAAMPGIHVIGTFDPLLAAQATRLSDLKKRGQPLVVLVDKYADLLPLDARLELAAALECVDFVAPYEDHQTSPIPTSTIDDRPLHRQWTSDLIRTVRAKNP